MSNEDDEFLRMAIQCGGADLSENADGSLTLFPDEIIALCKKVRDKQREKLAQWMIRRGLSTGHGNTIESLLFELSDQMGDP
jgi:hypothetical protein